VELIVNKDEAMREAAMYEVQRLGQEMELEELRACVKEFFEKYLNRREESDSGRMFAPVQVSSVRVMLVQPLGELLEKMRVLSGAKEANDE
jgi:hypothetical protein